jgi:hypothetical protein
VPSGQLKLEINMDKKIAGILGAVGALASLNAAQAATSSDPTEVLKARSDADLLEPIPNAMLALNAIDTTSHMAADKVQLAQNRHHHHHHHAYRRPRRHHHHHHHHE